MGLFLRQASMKSRLAGSGSATTPPVRPTDLLDGTLLWPLCKGVRPAGGRRHLHSRSCAMPRDRRQTSSQAPQLVRPLPPEAEGVEEFVVDALHDLADGSYPSPQALGPAPLAAVAFRRMDDARPVAFQP